MRRMDERFKILATLLVTPLVAGCAQIKHFSAAPSTICPGEPVQVEWKASDKVTLEAAPPVAGTGEGPPEGSRSLSPTQNTRLTLKVPALLKSAQSEWDITVIPAQTSRLLGGIAQCEGNPAVVTATFSVPQEDTSHRVRATSIGNSYSRALRISKDNTEADIPPGATSSQFRNVPVAGTWTIQAPVSPGESCDAALDSVRSRLTVNMQMSCVE